MKFMSEKKIEKIIYEGWLTIEGKIKPIKVRFSSEHMIFNENPSMFVYFVRLRGTLPSDFICVPFNKIISLEYANWVNGQNGSGQDVINDSSSDVVIKKA